MKCIQTERYTLERQAGKAMFGLYRNPFSHHPCVRSAVDSTANTNIVFGPAIFSSSESMRHVPGGPDYSRHSGLQPICRPDHKPYPYSSSQSGPYSRKAVAFGYEPKERSELLMLGVWSLDKDGKKTDEELLKQPWCGFIHDCVITKNFLVTTTWPFEATIERMKAGGHHWTYNYSKAVTFIVVRRHGH